MKHGRRALKIPTIPLIKLKDLSAFKLKRSLKTRLTVYLIIMALFPLILMGGIVNFFIKESMEKEVKEKTSVIVSNLNDQIDIFINQNKSLVSFLAATKTVRSMDRNVIEPFIYDMLMQNPQILRVIIADTQGSVYAVPFGNFPENYSVFSEAWYTGALDNKDTYITKVKVDPSSSSTILSISAPIISETGNIAGILCADISLVSLTRTVSTMNIGNHGYAFITDSDGYVIGHKDYKLVRARENFSKYDFVKQALLGKKDFTTFDENGNEMFVAYGPQKTTGWGIFVSQPVNEAYSNIFSVTRTFGVVGLLATLISIAMGIYIGNAVATPILRMVGAAETIAEGDLTEFIKIQDSTEIGALASSFNSMVSGLRNLVLEIMRTAGELSSSTEEQVSSAEDSKKAAEQISGAIEQIAAGAGDQSQKLTEISEIINQLVLSNGKIDENAHSTASSATEMLERARNGQRKMNNATESMHSIINSVDRSRNIIMNLHSSVKEIGKISDIIRDIVDQTNLLALNASIEAARAGEYGRGFSVVAQEIRKLADQSGKAAKQISEIVKEIQKNSRVAVDSMVESSSEVDSGRVLIVEANETFNRLIGDIEATARAAKQISEEVTSQYNNIEKIVAKINDIMAVSEETAAASQQVSASSHEQTASMESIASSARQLAGLAEKLSAMVNKFKV
ncbi:methyl-accepting chemotaxis protein [Thermosediminibacter litoriperuensis]|uniref:Methyl-accepting chemotaxis protein n=1 Tax=Thermosediminibacter litoriperuensis TaxID=291989 RepID=A0A5S5AY45_9FIRM|nr:methyl-accepting chemotaxis protein [Thermosediminibacter litoriperuensis]TYP58562.1 methyl-accepting chemotaxis protein [Thermosediminibacter litoriperuensis]